MKLKFLGTRGEIDVRTLRHQMHTSLLVSFRRKKIMIDCGTDWLGKIDDVSPHAIILTHAHPDHAWGLKQGTNCPVYATADAWKEIDAYPIEQRKTVEPRIPLDLFGVTFEAFPVMHSIRCPAVGYRISSAKSAFFYAPDLVYIEEREAALNGISIYIGDGATVTQSFVRKRGDALIGHAPVRTQLTWCEKEKVPRAIITHCGKQIVSGDEAKIEAQIREMGAERGVRAELAFDGLEISLR